MIDVHCHLNFEAFEKDYDEVIKRAIDAGVDRIINTGTSISSSAHAIKLAEKYENLYAIVGVHPHHADKVESDWIERLENLAKQKKVVGIGECGMDFYSYKSNGIVEPKIQEEIFIQQIELSYRSKLPLQIHNRQAGKKVIEILQSYKNNLLKIPGMFHCFAGSMDVLKSALQMGFYIGFDGNITYKGFAPGEDTILSDLAMYTPLDRIVTETDSPYLSPVPYRGSRNEPSRVIIVGQHLAKIKHLSFEEIDEQTCNNAKAVFSL